MSPSTKVSGCYDGDTRIVFDRLPDVLEILSSPLGKRLKAVNVEVLDLHFEQVQQECVGGYKNFVALFVFNATASTEFATWLFLQLPTCL
jgi:hypothetical protein